MVKIFPCQTNPVKPGLHRHRRENRVGGKHQAVALFAQSGNQRTAVHLLVQTGSGSVKVRAAVEVIQISLKGQGSHSEIRHKAFPEYLPVGVRSVVCHHGVHAAPQSRKQLLAVVAHGSQAANQRFEIQAYKVVLHKGRQSPIQVEQNRVEHRYLLVFSSIYRRL